jgi:tetratricopeptide (TPR) repeat protein
LKGDLDGAVAAYTQAIRIDSNYSEAYYNRGNVRYAQNEIDEAIADYTRSLAINPRFASCYINRGNTWRDTGEPGKAIADYDRALEINPNAAKAYANRGLAHLLQENATAAERDFAAAVTLDKSLLPLIEDRIRAIKIQFNRSR